MDIWQGKDYITPYKSTTDSKSDKLLHIESQRDFLINKKLVSSFWYLFLLFKEEKVQN
jgi:hypothetical protein